MPHRGGEETKERKGRDVDRGFPMEGAFFRRRVSDSIVGVEKKA
jgi:hypothetical protein